jgi:ElaB/YqjD/DUF883 family membrane-anchored ribosome-binding protein
MGVRIVKTGGATGYLHEDEIMDTGQEANRQKSNSGISSTSTEPKQEAHETGRSQALDAAVRVANQAGDAVAQRIEHARGTAEEVISGAKDAAEAVTSAAKQFSAQAPDIARRVRDQAGTIAQDLYHHGDEYLSRNVQANPLTALLIAGAVGYALGYLSSRYRWSSRQQ